MSSLYRMLYVAMILLCACTSSTIDAQQVFGKVTNIDNGGGVGSGYIFVPQTHKATQTGFLTSVAFVPYTPMSNVAVYVLRKVATLEYHIVGKYSLPGTYSGGAVRTVAVPNLPILANDYLGLFYGGGSLSQYADQSPMDFTSIASPPTGPSTQQCQVVLFGGSPNTMALQWTITNNAGATAPYTGNSCPNAPTQPAAGAAGDPQFAGLQGQSFQIHGFADSFFSLISTPTFQMNGRFAYIATAPTCQRNDTICWQHPGTYIDDVGFLVTLGNGEHLRIEIVAGSQLEGMKVYINGTAVHYRDDATALSYTWHGGVHVCDDDEDTSAIFCINKFSYRWSSPFTFTIRTNLWDITAVNSQDFYNLEVAILDANVLRAGKPIHMIHEAAHNNNGKMHDISTPTTAQAYPNLSIHGFIGNTWKNARYADRKLYQGCVADYETSSVFGTDSLFNQYGKAA